MLEEREFDCPFCNEGKIKVMYKPSVKVTKNCRGSAKRGSVTFFSKEDFEVLIKKCPNCGKTKKELERCLKEGKRPSREDVIKRMREAGLDPSKLK